MRWSKAGLFQGTSPKTVRAGTGLKLAGDDLDERAFARAVGADQAGQARRDFEADIVQPHDHAVPAAQFPRLDDGFIRV